MIDSSLGPVCALFSDDPDGHTRVRERFTETFPRFKDFEPQLRAGSLVEVPYRRGHRISILEHAIAPLPMKPVMHDRLHKALCLSSTVSSLSPS